MPDFDDWDKTEQGQLKVWPMLGFSTAVFHNDKGGLRLEVGVPPKNPTDPVSAVQVAFSEEQLRTLADALTDVADRIAAGKKDAGHA